MKQAYCEHHFYRPTQPLLEAIIEEVEKFEAMGLAVTVRQLYYRIRDRLATIQTTNGTGRIYAWQKPGDALSDKVGTIVGDARDCGLIDWDSIIDEGRNPDLPAFWDSAADLVGAAAAQFRLDRWQKQDIYVEVWTEKMSHVALMKQATSGLYVPVQMCRGYGSKTELRGAAGRFIEHGGGVVLYAGDHDASGMDIDRDVADRLAFYGADSVEVRRIALTMEQVRQHKLSLERVNMDDKRAKEYVRRFGTETWELDALDPSELQRLIRDAVEGYIDREAWGETEAAEGQHRRDIQSVAKNWSGAVAATKRKPKAAP